jgi:isopenicillin N synthase-like dioxygenase
VTGTVPTVDFAGFAAGGAARAAVVEALGAAFERCGFVSLVGHGIEPAVIDGAFAAAAEFFALPEAAKRAVQNRANNRGYVPMFDAQRPGEKPSGQEAFSMGHPVRPADPELAALPFHAETPWPAQPPLFRERLTTAYTALFALGEAVLRAVALHLQADEAFFAAASRDTTRTCGWCITRRRRRWPGSPISACIRMSMRG